MQKPMFIRYICLILSVLLMAGCGSTNPSIQLVELSSNTITYEEVIRINNCGGKGDSEQTVSHSFSTSIEGEGKFSVGYQPIVEGEISAKYGQYRNTTKSQRLVAPPGTDMQFVLRWSEDVRAGNVSVDGTTGTYQVRIPIAVEQVLGQDLGCASVNVQSPFGNQSTPSSSSPTQGIVSATIQPLPQSTTGYIPTCNWARDWQLQPDGSYVWIGLPPGSPECQNVGQDGELLHRLRNGENITLVVEVGNNFIGLNICKGDFTATEVIPGEKCVPKNPELWPKVKGQLIVTGSDGFSVGTGK